MLTSTDISTHFSEKASGVLPHSFSAPALRPQARLEARAEGSIFFSDAVPLTHNSTFDLYAYARGLNGVDQKGNFLFVHVSIACFLIIAFAFFILRLTEGATRKLRLITTMNATSNQRFWSLNQSSWWPWVKMHISYAPLWKKRHNRELQLSSAVSMGTLPSRFHTFLLTSYLTTNIAYCLVLPWDAKESHAVVAALRGRSGVLAAYNLIPLFLFAGRNNPLISLLNVSYDTFNLLHRWIGRMVVIEALIHTFCWLSNTYAAGQWPAIQEALQQVLSYKCGLAAMVIMFVMVIAATSPIRHAFYEIFLVTHKIFAVAALFAVYGHVADHRLPQIPWIQAALLLLGWEYGAQVVRLIYNNVAVGRVTRITVEALPAEASRVTVELVRPLIMRPGSHAHIRIPSLAWYSSHPFSIAWHSDGSRQVIVGNDVEKAPDRATIVSSSSRAHTVSFVVRARTGFTREIHDLAASQPSGAFTAMGLLEGPYGAHAPLDSYGTVILFAGGVGITHQVGFVKHLVDGHANGTVSCRKIRLIWSTPTRETLEWIRPWMDEILRTPGRRQVLQIKIFITKPRGPNELISGSGTLSTYPGRCNPSTIIEQEMQEQEGAMAVSVCGPGAFADGVRAAARDHVQRRSLDFFEEAFTY